MLIGNLSGDLSFLRCIATCSQRLQIEIVKDPYHDITERNGVEDAGVKKLQSIFDYFSRNKFNFLSDTPCQI